MKFYGGYTPRLAGRPLSQVDEIQPSDRLWVSLKRLGVEYRPVVKEGDAVGFGDPLAEAKIEGGSLFLPSPASGKISFQPDAQRPIRAVIHVSTAQPTATRYPRFEPQRATADAVRSALARGGVWPLIWSSSTGGTPPLISSELPKAVVVNCVLTEPFRARGKVVLRRNWNYIVQGIRFLPRIMSEYGAVDLVLTAHEDPVAKMMYMDLTGHAWVHFHPVRLAYPVENPRVLLRALRKIRPSLKKEDVVWVIDAQGMEAMGACLSEGLPLHQRVVAVGGPGCVKPRHRVVRIGTRIADLVDRQEATGKNRVLRGGIMTGIPVDVESDSVGCDDDAFFFLPDTPEREFLSFVRPGFDRTGYLPCFVSRLTGGRDQRVSTLLRGERRPCIACGLCEEVCPVELLPQMLHRCLFSGSQDEAEALGLDLCVECGLCAYVCPSKLDLRQEFAADKARVLAERRHATETANQAEASRPPPAETAP